MSKAELPTLEVVAALLDPDAVTLSREEFMLEYGSFPAWSSESQGARQRRARATARAIIDVIAPSIAAGALRNAAAGIQAAADAATATVTVTEGNPDIFDGTAVVGVVVEWLLSTADEVEGTSEVTQVERMEEE